jgi:hypothetical protein
LFWFAEIQITEIFPMWLQLPACNFLPLLLIVLAVGASGWIKGVEKFKVAFLCNFLYMANAVTGYTVMGERDRPIGH